MLVIIDYGVGNLLSILNMLKKAGTPAVISDNTQDIEQASKLILPGMGHFDNCMKKMLNSGLLPGIKQKVFDDKCPLLGICVGLQMFMTSSEEGAEPGLNWIEGKTVKFDLHKLNNNLKVPNMGWLEVKSTRESRLFQCLDNARFYFAHSFYVNPVAVSDRLLTAEYGYDITVGVERGNLLGVQFHPEKSHKFGLRLLSNFANNY
jgi:imidazole glycerol-phosphate synthase subunit HisH